jgi:hypothetical protein
MQCRAAGGFAGDRVRCHPNATLYGVGERQLGRSVEGWINETDVGGLKGFATRLQQNNGRTGCGLGSTAEYLWQKPNGCDFRSGDCYGLISAVRLNRL